MCKLGDLAAVIHVRIPECLQDINLATYVGTSMAHEIGHNFNMLHDNMVANCQCNDPTGNCIMYPSGRYVWFIALVSDSNS